MHISVICSITFLVLSGKRALSRGVVVPEDSFVSDINGVISSPPPKPRPLRVHFIIKFFPFSPQSIYSMLNFFCYLFFRSFFYTF